MGAFPGRCTESSTYTHRNGVRGGRGIGKPRDSKAVAHVRGPCTSLASSPLHSPAIPLSLSLFLRPVVSKRHFFPCPKGKEGLQTGTKKWVHRRSLTNARMLRNWEQVPLQGVKSLLGRDASFVNRPACTQSRQVHFCTYAHLHMPE